MTKQYNDFDNRITDHSFGIFYNFNCNMHYQKLGDKCELKKIRKDSFLKTSRLFKTIYNACWNARYELKRSCKND